MKKSLKVLALLIVIAFTSCDNYLTVSPKPSAPVPYIPPVRGGTSSTSIDFTSFRSFTSTRVDHVFNSTPNYDGQIGNIFYYNYERLILDEATTLNQTYQISNINLQSFAHDVTLSIVHQPNTDKIDIASYSGVSTYYNAGQISILNSYFTKMLSATSTTAPIYYSTAKSTVESSSLSNDQKIAVLALLEVGNTYASSFFAGQWNNVYNDIQTRIGATNGRVAVGPCTVSFRSVWIDAVAGGVTNGVRGAIIGAAGGTVGFPGLGTATGAIGGGVMGFAVGFVGGAATGVVTQLLGNCLFKEEAPQPLNPKCEDFDYMKEHFEFCQSEIKDIKKYYVIYAL